TGDGGRPGDLIADLHLLDAVADLRHFARPFRAGPPGELCGIDPGADVGVDEVQARPSGANDDLSIARGGDVRGNVLKGVCATRAAAFDGGQAAQVTRVMSPVEGYRDRWPVPFPVPR